jgi:hypothetical protein
VGEARERSPAGENEAIVVFRFITATRVWTCDRVCSPGYHEHICVLLGHDRCVVLRRFLAGILSLPRTGPAPWAGFVRASNPGKSHWCCSLGCPHCVAVFVGDLGAWVPFGLAAGDTPQWCLGALVVGIALGRKSEVLGGW